MRLRIGEKGDIIRQLQARLKQLGYDPGPLDGVYSDKMKEAVIEFQHHNQLETDGVVGPKTLQALGFDPQLHDPRPGRQTRRGGAFSPTKGKKHTPRR